MKDVLSHPVWVRGLKLCFGDRLPVNWVSHPVWVRGLKQKKIVVTDVTLASHPVWVRGLKPVYPFRVSKESGVAPRVGAWIETTNILVQASDIRVAPRVGAWIETALGKAQSPHISSHPVWVRGLKRW